MLLLSKFKFSFSMLLGLLNILVIALIVLLFKNINVYLGLIIIGIIF